MHKKFSFLCVKKKEYLMYEKIYVTLETAVFQKLWQFSRCIEVNLGVIRKYMVSCYEVFICLFCYTGWL